MKIAHLNTETGWGGGEAQTLYLVRGLQEAGHDCTLFVNPLGRLYPAACRSGLRVRTIPGGKFRHPGSVLYLAREFHRNSFDLCHFHTGQAVTIGSLATLGLRKTARVGSRRLGYPLARKWYRWNGPWMGLDHIIAVSDFVRGRLGRSGVPLSRVTVIHSGVDLKRFGSLPEIRSFRGSGGNRPVSLRIGSITRPNDSEAIGVFLDTCFQLRQRNRRFRFLLVGPPRDGAAGEVWKRRIRALDLEGALDLTGFREDIPELLKKLDCLVFYPPPGVGSPGVLKEAMAAGVPIVAADHPVIGEIVSPGEGAIVVPSGDPRALAREVFRILTEPDLACRLVRHAGSEVRRFSVSQMVEETLQVYRKVLSERLRQSAV